MQDQILETAAALSGKSPSVHSAGRGLDSQTDASDQRSKRVTEEEILAWLTDGDREDDGA